MNSFLFNRQLGSVSPQSLARAQNARLQKSLQSATGVRFASQSDVNDERSQAGRRRLPPAIAHTAGVNSLAIDRFEGRYLVSAGADSSLAVWDLEEPRRSEDDKSSATTIYGPIGKIARTSTTASLGVTHISFYPYDSLALLTSGYDRTLKLFSSETLTASATFDLAAIVYSHATSIVTGSSHLLVACATQHPAVRLIDLRSGAHSHSLSGHSGSVLTVAWHPKIAHLLATSGTDGVVRLWDIRRSASSLGVFDATDSIGVTGYDGLGTGARRRERGRAHAGAANGVLWTEDGRHVISVGHDERMRVWDCCSGANTLVNFGPTLKNAPSTTTLLPLLAPVHLSGGHGRETVYYPNPKEILSFDLHSGDMQSRLRVPPAGDPFRGVSLNASNSSDTRGAALDPLRNRTTCLTWRAHHIEMYSAHGDGTIRAWTPRPPEDVAADVAEEEEIDASAGEFHVERKRKRDEFKEMVKDLTGKKITLT